MQLPKIQNNGTCPEHQEKYCINTKNSTRLEISQARRRSPRKMPEALVLKYASRESERIKENYIER